MPSGKTWRPGGRSFPLARSPPRPPVVRSPTCREPPAPTLRHEKRRARRPALPVSIRRLLDGEDPDGTALRDVGGYADITLHEPVLDPLRIDAPARLHGNVLRPVDLVGNRRAGDARAGLLLPQLVAGLGIERAEHPVVRAADEDEIATRGEHGGEKLPSEVVLPHLLAGGGIPGLQLAMMVRPRSHGQPPVVGLVATPQLPGDA